MIHHLVTAGGYDENVMDALEAKEVTQDSFLDALKARIKSVKERTMGKIDAKMEGRTEGLELALRIVREGGAEALEREK